MKDEIIKDKVWRNSLCTCEYLDGYTNRTGLIRVRCIKHDYIFETKYDNVARNTRPHLICPQCKDEERHIKGGSIQCTCEYCGRTYWRQQSDIRSGHMFCSRECKDAAQRIESGDTFKDMRPDHYGDTVTSTYRKTAFAHLPHKCAICGWDDDEDVLQVHHIDENRSNNNLDNLLILCPTCHFKLTIHKYELNEDHTQIIKK